MLRRLRSAYQLASLASIFWMAGCGLFTRTPEVPPEPAEETPAPAPASASPHEVFASSLGLNSAQVVSVLYPPPAPLTELPPEARPAGEDVVWVPGYWLWDLSRDDWVWVNGVWVHAPSGRRWVPGYWKVVSVGWRWVHGYWAMDPPPPPLPPPQPPALTFGAGNDCYADPDLAFFFGMGWPWYQSRPLPSPLHGIVAAPLLPLGHKAGPIVSSPEPHAAEMLPRTVPPLTSTIPPSPATGALRESHAPLSPAADPSAPPHVNMESIFASMPQPLASSLSPPRFVPENDHSLLRLHAAPHSHAGSGVPGVLHDHEGRMASFFLNSHLETALHEHLSFPGTASSHVFAGERGGIGGHESGGQGSGGHGGGHGR
jgi:hypothetical protein